MYTEAMAAQANCPSYAASARFTLVEEDHRNGQVLVRCRKYSHDWTLFLAIGAE